MPQFYWLTSPLLNLCCILIFFLFLLASSIDPYYAACKNPNTTSCSDGQNITYPFYIDGKQDSFCGYPHFEVSCNDGGKPVLKLGSDDNYVIQKFYTNSILVSNDAVSSSFCPDQIRNVSIPDARFNFTYDYEEIILLSNCSKESDATVASYKVNSCSNGTVFAILEDRGLKAGFGDCEKVVSASVNLIGNESGKYTIDVEKVLKRGFELNWIAGDCKVCDESGGMCGFNYTTYQFSCFCTDRPHSRKCYVNSTTVSCGVRGFKVVCEGGKPIYRTSGSDYTIEEISYDDQSFRLVHHQPVVSDSCNAPLNNFTFDRSSLKFGPHEAQVRLFYNCSDSFSVNSNTKVTTISCASGQGNKSYAVLDNGRVTSNAGDACRSVAAPVELEEKPTIRGVKYTELLENGFILKWGDFGFDCVRCQKSGGRCGVENDTSVCYCPDDGSHAKVCKDDSRQNTKLLMGLGIGLGSLILISVLSIFVFKWYKKKKVLLGSDRGLLSSKSDLEGGSAYFGVSVFSHRELEEATNNFDSEKELGDGGFGIVYHGKLRDGREVAVKRLFEHNYKRVQQFMNEIQILTLLRHKNLVTLYGCTSRRSHELLLVYEYIPNGTVADHIHEHTKSSSLTWDIRMNIALETASALAYLHASDIIHRDVKSNNILLDNNFCVKVADFGLSRLFPIDVTHVSTAPQGTPGYVDPEYHECFQLTTKSDVYSFGVVLIELISSMPAVDISRHRHEIKLSSYAIHKIQKCEFDELIDSCLGHKSDKEVRRMTTSVAELAFRCLQQDKEMRPSMQEVLEELQIIQSGEYRSDNEKIEEHVSGEYNFEKRNLEVHQNSDDSQTQSISTQPKLSSSPEYDDVSLLENIKLPPSSPISVATKWISTNTTPNTST